MTLYDKVQLGVRCCMSGSHYAPDCENCPYAGDNDICDSVNSLFNDMLALLKPRVMPLEEANEALHTQQVVYVETTDRGIVAGIRKDEYFEMQTGEVICFDDLEDPMYTGNYGKMYRLWTMWPTQKQLEETPWQ